MKKRQNEQHYTNVDHSDEAKRRRRLQTQAQLEAYQEDAQEIAALLQAQAQAQAQDEGNNVSDVQVGFIERVRDQHSHGGAGIMDMNIGVHNHNEEPPPPPPQMDDDVLPADAPNVNVHIIRNRAGGTLPQSQSHDRNHHRPHANFGLGGHAPEVREDSDVDDADDRIWLAPSQRRVSRVGNDFQANLPGSMG